MYSTWVLAYTESVKNKKGGGSMQKNIPDLDDFIFADEEYSVSER